MMKRRSYVFVLLVVTGILLAGSVQAGKGYTLRNSQNIMHFVQLDEGKATDVETYRQAIKDICKPNVKCQVLFWAENAPTTFPMSREQTRSRTAYWQYDKKTDSHRLYVDCKLFGDIENAECF
jgi:hypothetical protein